MIELRVPESCRIAGLPLAEVGFPRGAILGAVLRGDKVIIPTGRDSLQAGDNVVVFTVGAAVDKVERIFAS